MQFKKTYKGAMNVAPFFFSLVLTLCIAMPAMAFDVPLRFQSGITIVYSDMAPISFLGLNGEPKGFLIDFWRKWAQETGVPVEFKQAVWKDGLELVKSGGNHVHAGMYKLDKRKDTFDFGDEIFPIQSVLVVKADSPITGFDDLGDAVVGVMEKGSTQMLMKERYPHVKLKPYPSVQAEVEAFVNDEVEAVVVSWYSVIYMLGKMGVTRDVVQRGVLYEKALYTAVAKGNDDLLNLVNQGMEMVDAKERQIILDRWYVKDSSVSKTLKIGALLALGALIFAVLMLVFGGRLKRLGK